MAKRPVRLYLEEDLVRRAREIGLNLSAFVNRALADFLERHGISPPNTLQSSEKAGKEVDPPGFEPGASRSQGLPFAEWGKQSAAIPTNTHDSVYIRIRDEDIADFRTFLLAQGLSIRTIYHHIEAVRALKRYTGGVVTQKKILAMMAHMRKRYSVYHLANYVKGWKRFFRDYLRRPEFVEGIKTPRPSVAVVKPTTLPSKDDLRKVAEWMLRQPTAVLDITLLLMYMSTGLRRSELLTLRPQDIVAERCIVLDLHRRTKKTGITFFTREAEAWLQKYMRLRGDVAPDEPIFHVTQKHFQKLWRRASRVAGKPVTPQVLRKWHAVTLRMAGVPDSFVDIFQGRAPHSVLAQYYTPVGIEELRKVYERAEPALTLGV